MKNPMLRLLPLLLVLLPYLARADGAVGAGEGYFFMFLLGAAGVLLLLLSCGLALVLTANITRSSTVMSRLTVGMGLVWGIGTYWCVDSLLNPACWFYTGPVLAAEHNHYWEPHLLAGFWADAVLAALLLLLAWRRFHSRLHQVPGQ